MKLTQFHVLVVGQKKNDVRPPTVVAFRVLVHVLLRLLLTLAKLVHPSPRKHSAAVPLLLGRVLVVQSVRRAPRQHGEPPPTPPQQPSAAAATGRSAPGGVHNTNLLMQMRICTAMTLWCCRWLCHHRSPSAHSTAPRRGRFNSRRRTVRRGCGPDTSPARGSKCRG